MSVQVFETNGAERARYGVIVTAREQQTGRVKTMHQIGAPTGAIHEVVETLDSMEGDWKVVSISTPASIYRDLQGGRSVRADDQYEHRPHLSDPRTTEVSMLSRLGRLDLLEPLRNPGADVTRGKVA